MNQITVEELKTMLDNNTILLIDVREPWELTICQIDPCINIPLNKLNKYITELNKNNMYGIICHSGVRSANACIYLQNSGFNVVNVIGGIDSWSINIDPQIKRY